MFDGLFQQALGAHLTGSPTAADALAGDVERVLGCIVPRGLVPGCSPPCDEQPRRAVQAPTVVTSLIWITGGMAV